MAALATLLSSVRSPPASFDALSPRCRHPNPLSPFFAGWLPLDLYRAAGKEVRREKQVKHHWPEPIQPEPELVGGGFWAEDQDGLFAESAVAAIEREVERGRLVVQW